MLARQSLQHAGVLSLLSNEVTQSDAKLHSARHCGLHSRSCDSDCNYSRDLIERFVLVPVSNTLNLPYSFISSERIPGEPNCFLIYTYEIQFSSKVKQK